MANTLTNLLPDAYAALDVVSRELTGLIPAVTIDAQVNRAAVGQTVRNPVAPASAGEDISPSMSDPAIANQVISNSTIQISKSRAVPFSWSGVEQDQMNQGPGYANIRVNQIAQAVRTLVNEAEADLAGLHVGFSRATGTAGTTPFGTAGNFTDATNALKILKDNGAPQSDNQLILDTSAGAQFLGLQSNASVAFEDSIMNQGVFRTISGMNLRESGQIVTSSAGTGSGYLVNDASAAVGQTVIPADTGTGTIIAGDVVTFAGDDNKYVVTEALAAGSFTIAAPGLRKAPADNAAITVVAAAARNMAFNRSAIVLATRLPPRPEEGDKAIDVTTITDPRSGLSMELAIYPGNRMVRYEVAMSWGVSLIKPEHSALLLG